MVMTFKLIQILEQVLPQESTWGVAMADDLVAALGRDAA
jgi:hypothetical protein